MRRVYAVILEPCRRPPVAVWRPLPRVWRWLLVAGALVMAGTAFAAPKPVTDPLTVVCAGASKAPVYVAPLARVPSMGPESLEADDVAFRRGFYRGETPLRIALAPGDYVVSVALPTEYNMREAMRRAQELTWDGFNQHAVVLSRQTDNWQYARCYVVKKVAGQPLTVFAAFTEPGSLGRCDLLAASGGAGGGFAATVDEALTQLDDAGLPSAFANEVADAALDGRKVLLTTGDTRWAVYADGSATLVIRHARASGIWSGRRLSVLTPD